MSRAADISPLSVLLSRVDAVTDGQPPVGTFATGFPSLDKMLGGGVRRGDLVVLGGDVASGKSALALAFAIRASIAGARVAFLTAEMTVERVLERVIAIEARARIDELRLGTLDEATRAKAGAVALELRDHLPVIEGIAEGGVEALGTAVSELPEIDLLIVDSMSALASGELGIDDDTADVVRQLKQLALGSGVALLVTAPLPHLAPRADRRPTLDDFGGRGCIKQHADIVLGLFRQDMYEPARDIAGATELLVLKNRNGPTGYVDLYFYAQWMRFEDMLDPDR
jgi:replicative DNA helicase